MGAAAAESAIEIPPIISVDDHVIEPPHVWQSRLPSRYADIGPRVVTARARSPTPAACSRGLRAQADPPRIGTTRTSTIRWSAPTRRWPFPETSSRWWASPSRRCSPAPGRWPRGWVTWTSAMWTPRCASRRSPGSAARPSPRPPTWTWLCCACRPTTTGWWRSGAAPVAGG